MSQTSEQLMQDILLYRHNIDLMMMPIVQEFVVEDYDFIMEDGNNTEVKSTTSDGPNPQVVASEGPKVDQSAASSEKVKQFLKNLLNKFKGWIQNVIQTVSEKFTKNYQSQINYVAKNKVLNEEIAGALGSTFKPTVQDWPKYHIPLDKITNMKLSTIIEKYTTGEFRDKDINPVEIKQAFYPEEMKTLITESYYVQESEETQNGNNNNGSNENTTKELTKNQKMLKNFFLFGKPAPSHDECWTNTLDGNLWLDTCDNITNCSKAIGVGIKAISNDFKNTLVELQKSVSNLETSAKEEIERGREAKQNEDMDQRVVSGKIVGNIKRRQKRIQDLIKVVTDISNEFGVGFAETMQQAFFVTSYNLYKDIVFEYRKTGGETGTTTNQSSQPQNANNNTEQPTT